MGDLNFITDAIAWNRYDGWYGGTPADLGKWLDRMHKDHPEICIAISEYGAGASIYHQQDSLVKTVPTSWWHPENWQTYYHIENWKTISSRPYVWGALSGICLILALHIALKETVPELMIKVWLPSTGKFVKMLSTSINWNREEPMLYLTGKRNTVRTQRLQTITAFTNLSSRIVCKR